jgi:hypothetical protein
LRGRGKEFQVAYPWHTTRRLQQRPNQGEQTPTTYPESKHEATPGPQASKRHHQSTRPKPKAKKRQPPLHRQRTNASLTPKASQHRPSPRPLPPQTSSRPAPH